MIRLVAYWKLIRNVIEFGPAPLCDEEWNEAHAKALKGFMATETGRLLLRKFSESRTNVARNAVLERARAEYASGYAAGYDMALSNFETLSVISPPQVTESKQPGLLGGKALVETLAP